MEVSLVKTNIDFDKFPESVRSVHEFWLDIYDRSPLVAMFILVMIPIIIMYGLYTWGTIRRLEQSKDEEALRNYEAGLKKKRRKK